MPPERSPQRAAVAAALRQLGHDFVGHHADDEVLDELAGALASYSRRLASGSLRSRERFLFHEHWDTDIADGEPVHSFESIPLSGAASPWSVEPDVRRDGDGVVATVTFGPAHEGAPERCHGGIVAALFDDMLGCVLSVIGEGAFTGELTIRYDAPVPLHRELVCRCRVDHWERRKLFMTGELTDQGVLVSSAKAVFVQPRDAPSQSTFDPV